MSKYRYFVFDFDLTLADSSEGILECFKHVLKEFGYQPKDDRTIYNTIGMTLVDAFDLLTDMPDNPQREDMRKAYVKKADEVMVKKTYFYDDTIALLQTLQNAGVKVGIVSTKYRYRIVNTFNEQAGSLPVDIIVGGEDVTKAKPDPEMYLTAISRFGLKPDECVVVEDNPNGVKAGLASGAYVLQVETVYDVNYTNIRNKIDEVEA